MSLYAFFIAALVLALTPGPGIAYVVARTIAGGRREGLASCVGTGLGGLVHVVATALGLSVFVAQSAMAFSIIKFLGATYLIYLGVRILLKKHESLGVLATSTTKGMRKAFLEGVVVESLNIKTALFFLAFLPQFTTPNESIVTQLIILGGISVSLNTLVDIAAVFGAQQLMKSYATQTLRLQVMQRSSGLTMLGLGIYLTFAKRS